MSIRIKKSHKGLLHKKLGIAQFAENASHWNHKK